MQALCQEHSRNDRNARPGRLTRALVGLAGIATLGIAWSLALTGLAVAESHHPMRFQHLTLDDGLSQSNVMAILQDSRGLMWFGTENGLNRYDGYEIRSFKRERGNPESLGSDFIYDLAEDADGNLWIATNGGGLARLAPGDTRFESYRAGADKGGLSSNVVRRILVDADGSLWLGTRGAGLDRLDPKTGAVERHRFDFDTAGDASANEIYALYRDAAGALWVGSNRGLTKLDPASGDHVHFRHDAQDPASLSDDRVRAIIEDDAGMLWVGTYGGGLNRLDTETGAFERFRHDPNDAASLGSDRVTSLYKDTAGRIWAGTSDGLHLVAGQRFVRYAHDATDPTSLGDDSVTALFQDAGGILWVGTRNRGLSRWNPNGWSYGLQSAKQLSADAEAQPNVTSFAVDAAGRLWVGTFGDGLTAIDRQTGVVQRYRHDPRSAAGLSDNRVMSLLLDRNGSVWVGTMTGGINRIEPASGAIDRFRHDPADPASVSADGIMALFEDSKGRIWVGTFGGGMNRLDPGSETFARYAANPDDPAALSSNRVTAFAEDPSGLLWVGTDAGGLNLFNPEAGTFRAFRHDPEDPRSLASDTIYAITVDDHGGVWVGTRGGGLDRVVGSVADPQSIRFENLSQVDGLANDVVYGVQADDSGRLWLSTNYGISQYDPASGAIRNLHRNDGLQSEEFNFGAHYRSADGELFFGGHNGYNAFRPDGIERAGSPPPLMLTGVFRGNEPLRAGEPIDPEEGIEIGHRDDTVSFEFAALDFAAPARNQYRYKLEGFDGEWIELGNRRRVTYTDLDAGSYLLRVQAANSAGIWNEAGLSVPLAVRPAPWNTWWAWLGYGIAFLGLVLATWYGHRRKIAREEEYSRRLELEVRERTGKLLERNRQLNQLNHTLQQSSLSDPLTGLRNRRFVFEEVSRDLEVARRKHGNERDGIDARGAADLVFMMIDLDHFKPVNDTFGHAAGDEMLLQVRDVLLGACRRSDFVVRWGGDEFVVIAKQALPGESEALAERIRSRIEAHNFELESGQLVRTTCSIGFAQYPLFRAKDDDANLDQILGLADSLMYEAKKVRNAWAGLLSPTEAVASFDVDNTSFEPTSLLFQARRAAGNAGADIDVGCHEHEAPRLAAVR